MSETLTTYLQNSIGNLYAPPAVLQAEEMGSYLPDYGTFPFLDPIEREQSSVYGIFIEIEGASAKSSSSLVDLENAFISKYKSRLCKTIELEEFIDGETNEAYELFDGMLSESKTTSMAILHELYWEKLKEEDVRFLIKLLNILAYCPFEQVKEVGLSLFAAAILHKDIRVKSAALRVAGHWMCPELLVYLDKLDIAEYPFLEKKYFSIKTAIQEKWNMQEK